MIVAEAKAIPGQIKELETGIAEKEQRMKQCRMQIPNIMEANVPVGKSDEDNPTVEEWGERKTFDRHLRSEDGQSTRFVEC